jgi:hypothetical protein
LPSSLSAHTTLSIPAIGAFQLRLTPLNSTRGVHPRRSVKKNLPCLIVGRRFRVAHVRRHDDESDPRAYHELVAMEEHERVGAGAAGGEEPSEGADGVADEARRDAGEEEEEDAGGGNGGG